MSVAGQTSITYGYDNANRLTQIQQGSSATVTIAPDADSRRQSVTLPDGVSMNYGYDVASQLTGITYRLGANTLGNLTYGYDLAGRRTGVGGTYARTNVPAAASAASYNVNNQLTNWKGATLTYDLNGNLTSDGTNTYSWNARNQLVTISGVVNASFQYDPFGRRVSKNINGTTQFLYDGANPVQEISGSSAPANLITGGVDEYFQRTDSAGARSFMTDALGSTLALADSTGTLQTQYTFEPFGNTSTTGPTTTNSFAFTGRELDATGLYFYRARYYNPQLQRFTSEDPLDFSSGDINLYTYAMNIPTNLIDPSGLTWQTNWNFFWDWFLGLPGGGAQNDRVYGPNSVETQEMSHSPGGEKLRAEFYKNHCQNVRKFAYGTYEAYWDTVANPFTADWSSTAAQAGGFAGAIALNNGDGTVTFAIPNTAGTHSFFLHLVPDITSPTGPMHNIEQTFWWTEPIDPGRKGGCK